ncbi:lysophospholipid acyltransferase family protein [Actinomyces oris]|uniref:lysophospholipid acyltransferase family protein n=2 Tax=Actinomycetaceae TaxID=2049 RepID=UPI000C7940D6|nr:lysophospholipid acyltransferase family protein [Actinomyces oris]PKY75702.1 1-acyl-sn-glycerol-3-phosphate acyltransferase [Actinomyces oris]WCA43735.1 lysophospholipid acyltransferase family protein [Actinomyces oris]
MGYGPIKATVGPALEMLYQPWIRGEENIPAEGAAILASNHLAVIDSFFLPLLVDREVAFIGKADYFTGKGVKGWAVKNFMKTVGTIPVDRSGGKASQAALQAGIDRLRSGQLFGIYPEGTRSPDGRLYRGKTGVARIALATGAPVVPVAMIGSNLAQPIGKSIPSTRHRVGIVIGEPLDFSRYKGLENDRFVLRSITDEIMYALMALSGQEYVDLYAADVKKAMDSEKKTADEVVTEMLAAQAQARPSAAPVAAPGGRPAPEVSVPEPPEDKSGKDKKKDKTSDDEAEPGAEG